MPAREKNQCPYIKDPLDSCYVLEMSSQSVEKTLYFCAGNYQKCEVYRQAVKTNQSAEARAETKCSSTL